MAPAIAQTMKRLVLVKRGRTFDDMELRVETVPVPTPVSGEVLVRMTAAPVNPSDYDNWRVSPDKMRDNADAPKVETVEPALPCGREGSGVVVANGGGIKGWRLVGKAVAVCNARDGTYQEYVCVPSNMVIPLTDSALLVEDMCSAIVNPFTAVGMATTAKEMKSPCFILTAAASSMGQMLNRAAQDLDVQPLNIVRKASQAKLLEDIGAKLIINTANKDWKEKLREMVVQNKVTVAFDAIGGSMAGTLLGILPPEGNLYACGQLSGEPMRDIEPLDLIYRKKQILPWLFWNWINGDGLLHSLWRNYHITASVMANLHPEGWASSKFKDCTFDTVASTFQELYNSVGFTETKLRILF